MIVDDDLLEAIADLESDEVESFDEVPELVEEPVPALDEEDSEIPPEKWHAKRFRLRRERLAK